MLVNNQIRDELPRVDLPPENLLNRWLEITNKNSSNVGLDSDEWDKRIFIVFQVIELAQTLYTLLGTLPIILGIPEKAHLRSSITIPLPDHTMAKFVSRDSQTGEFFSETFSQLRWGNDPQSIAGVCATKEKPILLPNVNDRENPFQRYWISSLLINEGGVLAVPILVRLNHGGIGKDDCVAVLSITVAEPGILKEQHLTAIKQFSMVVSSILTRSTILPSSEDLKQSVVDRLFFGASPSLVTPDNALQNENTKKILADLISDLHKRTNPGKKAMKALAMLELFQSFGEKGIPLPDLFLFFEGASNKARRVSSEMSNLNNRYLKERGLQICGITVYRVCTTQNKTK
jgi:hypothetical protein